MANDFVIENGILKKYKGKGGDVVIPDGVTKIGNSAFRYCRSLTSITLPESVTSIGDSAFYWCSSLTSITLPEGVTSIGDEAFSGCNSLTSITIPEGVTSIGDRAFRNCSSLTSIAIPEGVTSIGNAAFDGCAKLTTFEVRNKKLKIPTNIFSEYAKTLPKGLRSSAYGLIDNLTDAGVKNFILLPEVWKNLSREQKKEVFTNYHSKALLTEYSTIVDAAIVKELGEQLCGSFTGKLSAKDCGTVSAYIVSFQKTADEKTQVRLAKGLKAEKNGKKALDAVFADCPQLAALLDSHTDKDDVNTQFMRKLNISQSEIKKQLKQYYAIDLKDLAPVAYQDGTACAPEIIAWVLCADEKLVAPGRWDEHLEASGELGIKPEVTEVIDMLSYDSFQNALTELAEQNLGLTGKSKKMFLAYPICRYADRQLMEELTARAPKWRSSVSGNDAPPLRTFRDACLFNEERCVMLFAEKYGDLDRYARIRGTDADTIRDTVLSDVGLDADGKKSYDLGGTTIEVTLQKDLTFRLFDIKQNKVVKSIPKKGNDEALVAAAAADYTEIKKNAKKIAQSRVNRLFETFLSGETVPAERWKNTYFANALLRCVAELIVWEQAGKTFTIGGKTAILADGTEYAISDAPIRVAHPLEMKPDDVKGWQKYFTANALKQPFAQIWESAIDPKTVDKNRYTGCTVPINFFRGAEKHGLSFCDEDFHNEVWFYVNIRECKLEGGRTEYHRHELLPDETFTLGEFSFSKYTRRVNHLVTVLDRWTVYDRIKKDDTSVASMLDSFTLAQIMEFVGIANENGATNVTALLLDYKNAHFADLDPMEEFTLDW